MRVLRRDFRVRVRHREYDRVIRHRLHHLLRHGTFGGHAKKYIRATHRVLEAPIRRLGRMCRLPLVHAFGSALINDTLGVARDAIVVFCTHRLDQLDTGNPGGTSPVQHDLDVFDLLTCQEQRVEQAGRADDSGAMLVVMENGDIHLVPKPLFDNETFRCLDVFKVNPPE